MKLGTTTSVLDTREWYKQLDKLPTKTVEIGARSARIFFDTDWVEKRQADIKDFNLSLHSGTVKIFTKNEYFTKAEIERLKAEIILCNTWNIRELIFHLKHEKLNKDEIRVMRDMIKLAKKYNVQLIYESNGCLIAEVALDLLKRLPGVKYNLDLGHLNVGIENKKLGCELDAFLREIDEKTVYVHAHNNYGKDSHLALHYGTLNWKYVLGRLNHVQKIISETRTEDDNKANIESLYSFYKGEEIN